MNWTKVSERHPPPHAKYHVRRGDTIHTATPCYGMHQPWWVQTVMRDAGNLAEIEPTMMVDSDEWSPL